MKRRWTINGRFLSQEMTGVQRYASRIARGIDELLAERHPLTRDLSVEIAVPPGCADVARTYENIPIKEVGFGGGHVWEQGSLPLAVGGGLLSLGNSGPVSLRKHIVCLHDVNTRIVPQSYSASFRALYRVLLPALGRSAERITTVSHFSASQIAHFGIAPLSKISVVPNGHEHALEWSASSRPAADWQTGLNTILMLGSRARHKNAALLVSLAPQLKTLGLNLAIAGAANSAVFASDVPDVAASDNLHWLGRVSDDDLATVLKSCLCFAFPSFTEGFGLPPLEAMALGCPVVVSDRASLPEICGSAALYASPDDPSAWLRQFVRLRDDAALRDDMRSRGLQSAARYSWRSSAEQYLVLMAESDGVTSAEPERVLAQA